MTPNWFPLRQQPCVNLATDDLLDRFQKRWDAPAASLVLGLVWWTWHLPLFVLPGYFDAFGRSAAGPLDLLPGILASAVVYTCVYNNTRRSVLAVVVLHFMQNFTGEFLGIAGEVRPVRLVLEVALALALVAWWGQVLRGSRLADTACHS